MTVSAIDPRAALLAAPMSAYQKIGVAVTLLLCMLDGFDVFTVTFAAPAIKTAWSVNQTQLGLVLSSGLLGMAAGSLLIAPAADLFGRRTMLFVSLALMIGGDIGSANTHAVHALMLTRIVTGLGIGTMIAIISSLAAEYANARRRDFCMTVFGSGFALGGTIGGFFAAYLLPHYGWPAIFLAAASLGLIMVLVVLLFLPEPIAPMIARPKSDTLTRVNAYLARCGMAPISALPPPPAGARTAPLKALFAPGMSSVTIMITGIYFLNVVTLFFALTWAPALIAGMGFAPAKAALVGMSLNIGGVAGGLLLGANSMRFGLKTLVVTAMIVGSAATALFGSIPGSFLLLTLGAIVIGFFMQGAMMGLYAVVARSFPAHMRVSGTGMVIGIGRIGSAVGPALAGVLLSAGIGRGSVTMVMAAPVLAAALLLLKFKVRSPDTP